MHNVLAKDPGAWASASQQGAGSCVCRGRDSGGHVPLVPRSDCGLECQKPLEENV